MLLSWYRSTKPENKYHNIKTVVDGITFDSKKEARRYQEIKLMERAGIISGFIRQPKFVLQDKFTTREGVKEQAITYKADFAIKFKDKSIWTIWEVKGGNATRTDDYELRRKMFLKRYPCVDYLIV